MSAMIRTWFRSLALAALMGAACSRPSTSEPAPTPPPAPPPEPVAIREGQSSLLFTYRDRDSGRFVTVERREDVPEAAREAVVVVDLELAPEARGSTQYVHVADLREPRADGSFSVAIASRHRFGQRPISSAGDQDGFGRDGVVLYSASWCGVCKKTARLLREWRVPFDERDIEASRSALEELGAKAAQAGIRPGGVPVIDVQGVLLQGLDPERLRALLAEKGLLPG